MSVLTGMIILLLVVAVICLLLAVIDSRAVPVVVWLAAVLILVHISYQLQPQACTPSVL